MTSEPTGQGPGPPGGWRIGRYRVEAVLGTGAFATVYRAVDERLDDIVAVKVLAENHSLDPEIRMRFLTEGRVLRRIDSPHVVNVHDLGETERQQPFLVLEHASRGTLAERARDLRASGWLPETADLRAVAEPLARALDAIHRAGVVHRDVNPGNVLVTTRGVTDQRRSASSVVRQDERIVLADLGLCKDLALHSGHTSAGGTEGFRPPELRSGPAVIDGRADLWSLSALLLWLATGSPPDGTPLEAAASRWRLPAGLARVLARGLADDPGARHPDALTWLADVEAALALTDAEIGTGIGTGKEPHPGAGPQPSPTPWSSHPIEGSYAGVGAAAQPAPTGQMNTWPVNAGSPPMGPVAPTAPGAPAQRAPGAQRVPPASRSWRWRLRHSAWLLATVPLGLTTWAGFLYIGWRARRTRWWWAAGGYGAAAVSVLAFLLAAPLDEDGQMDINTWQANVGTAATLVLWVGGLVHALVANNRWLRWRAQVA